jgi:transcriptional regulator with XRE-family HTH domain
MDAQKLIRQHRKLKGFSQSLVAKDIQAGRSTIISIESGDIRRVSFGKVVDYARAVGLSVDVISPLDKNLLVRRLSRAEHRLLIEKRKTRHLILAARLSENDINDALSQVELWSKKNTCSQTYIDRWRLILSGSVSAIAKQITESINSDWGDALLQNSPFVQPGESVGS